MVEFTRAEAITRLDLENLKTLPSKINAVIDVVEKFDGKVLNKRFKDALNATGDSYFVNTDNRFTIEIYFRDNRSIKDPVAKDKDYGCTIYTKHDKFALVNSWNNELIAKMLPDNRICAAEITKELRKQEAEYVVQSESLEGHLKVVKDIQRERDRLTEMIEEFNRTTNSYIDTNFEMRIDVRNLHNVYKN